MKSEVAHKLSKAYLSDRVHTRMTQMFQKITWLACFRKLILFRDVCDTGGCCWFILGSVSVQVHGSPPARMVVLAWELNALSLGTVWPLYPLNRLWVCCVYWSKQCKMFTSLYSVTNVDCSWKYRKCCHSLLNVSTNI